MYNILQLNDMQVPELKELAEELKVKNHKKLTKEDLTLAILDAQSLNPEFVKEFNKEKAIAKKIPVAKAKKNTKVNPKAKKQVTDSKQVDLFAEEQVEKLTKKRTRISTKEKIGSSNPKDKSLTKTLVSEVAPKPKIGKVVPTEKIEPVAKEEVAEDEKETIPAETQKVHKKPVHKKPVHKKTVVEPKAETVEKYNTELE